MMGVMNGSEGKAGRVIAGAAVLAVVIIVTVLVHHATHHCAATIPGTPHWCK